MLATKKPEPARKAGRKKIVLHILIECARNRVRIDSIYRDSTAAVKALQKMVGEFDFVAEPAPGDALFTGRTDAGHVWSLHRLGE